MIRSSTHFVVSFNLTGLVDNDGVNDKGTDQLPFTTIIYANGPGGYETMDSYIATGNRPDVTNVDTGKTSSPI